MKNFILKFATIMGALLLFIAPVTVLADSGEAPYYGFGTTNGRTDTVNINDYSTNSWDRFTFDYQFESGADYRYDFGSATTYYGIVELDVYNANIRRDKNVAYTPPSYGVFSGNVATQPTNYLFEQQANAAYWNAYQQADTNVIPVYDTLQQGVNATNAGNAMNMYNVGQTGALASTSIGGEDISAIGANNATGSYYQQDGDWYYQSGNSSSTVISQVYSGFLSPTSVE